MSTDFDFTPTGWPWALPLGQCQGHAAAAVLPLAWPTAPGGLWLRAAPGAEAATAHAAEAAALQLLRALPWRQAQVQVFDFGIRKRFATLAQLQPLGLYRLWPDAPEAARGLAELERLARHRHHQLLDEATPTLADYNRQAPQPEPWQVLLLNVDDFPHDAASSQRLATVLREAPAAGIYVLAFGGAAPAPHVSPNAAGSLHPPAPSTSVLAELYPQLQVLPPATPDAPAGLALLGGPGTAGLAALLQRHRATLSLPNEPLAPLLASLREQAAAEEAREPEQDFLQVPVGTTLDGREPVLWRMGAKSGSNNALMLGMPGSGKSTLLNNLIVGIAERFTAEQLRLVLMDYKDGVEFQAFAQHPNVERIFLDNEDTAAATRLLEEFQATIHERNERFKALQANVRNLDDYNRLRPEEPLPRLLLVVDEAQRLLSMADRRSQRFADLLVDVTRRGRSAGVHIILSTQSLEGVSDVNRLKAGISLRVAFKLNSPTDAERVLDAGNTAPLHFRNYEFVLNADNGRKAANVLARGLPTPDVAARLAAVRAGRPAHLCTAPVVVRSGTPAVPLTTAMPAPPVPALPAAATAVVPPPAVPMQSKPGATPPAAEEDVLARLQRLHGIRPNLAPMHPTMQPPLPENPT